MDKHIIRIMDNEAGFIAHKIKDSPTTGLNILIYVDEADGLLEKITFDRLLTIKVMDNEHYLITNLVEGEGVITSEALDIMFMRDIRNWVLTNDDVVEVDFINPIIESKKRPMPDWFNHLTLSQLKNLWDKLPLSKSLEANGRPLDIDLLWEYVDDEAWDLIHHCKYENEAEVYEEAYMQSWKDSTTCEIDSQDYMDDEDIYKSKAELQVIHKFLEPTIKDILNSD